MTRGRNTKAARSTVRPGQFVRARGSLLGRGKLLEVDGDVAVVEYFDSPAQRTRIERRVPLDTLEREQLGRQCRVYWQDPAIGTWLVGRVDEAGVVEGNHFGSMDDLYVVTFPNRRTCRIPEPELHVRWDNPVTDPVAYLAARTTETPYFHDARMRLVRSALRQRAHCRGLTGLYSASVDLQPHQFRVVQRVLHDPVQRYLLADEVGLGKTIEASAILRQYVLEYPQEHRAAVVVPEHLVDQWTAELTDRFQLSGEVHVEESVVVVTLEGLLEREFAPGRLGMLIVDEAHHPAALAFSENPDERARYRHLAEIAASTPRLLLLSATPVLRNEDGFLAMLHLLDPRSHRLDDREGFRRRVSQRQEIAAVLNDLQDESNPMFIEDSLDQVEALLPGDPRLPELVAAVRPLVDEDEEEPARQAVLRALRTHIGEIYRLHRRLIRNRRGSIEDLLRGRSGAEVHVCPDPARVAADELLDTWRAELSLSTSGGPNDAAARRLWGLFLDASLSHPAALLALVVRRLRGQGTLDDWSSAEVEALDAPALGAAERRLLQEIANLLRDYEDPRLVALQRIVEADPKVAFVVFVDRPFVADRLARDLGSLMRGGVVRHAGSASMDAFHNDDEVRVLVCDHTAEEGLNLHQRKAVIVHYDLPLSPNRVEQRIGRLDRFGGRVAVRSHVFDHEAGFASLWMRCLVDDVGVFGDSVASLQYVLDDLLADFLRDTFEEGAEAFGSLRGRMADPQKGLRAELQRIQHQENLDGIEAALEDDDFFLALEDFDEEYDELERDFEDWLLERLLFRRRDIDDYCQRYEYKRGGGQPSLVEFRRWWRWFQAAVDPSGDSSSRFLATAPMTWSRRQAWTRCVPLLRVGNVLVDGAMEHLRHDDRGISFRCWRWRPGCGFGDPPLLAFRADFMVEADLAGIASWLEEHPEMGAPAIRRMLDDLLPPQFLTVWLDEDLELIDPGPVREVLDERYMSRRRDSGRDFNLNASRWRAAEARVDLPEWSPWVRASIQRAEQEVRRGLDLERLCQNARSRLADTRATVTGQREARLVRLDGAAQDEERRQLTIEAKLHGLMDSAIASPRVRADSVGAMLLADWHPFGGAGA